MPLILGRLGFLVFKQKDCWCKKKTAYILSTPVCMPTYKLSKQQIPVYRKATSTKRSNGRNIKFWHSSVCWSEGIHSMIVSMKCIVSMGVSITAYIRKHDSHPSALWSNPLKKKNVHMVFTSSSFGLWPYNPRHLRDYKGLNHLLITLKSRDKGWAFQ